MVKCLILQANQKHKMMKTTVETEKKIDFEAIEDDLTPEQRAYWEASIERDMRDIAEGKPKKYLTLDEFETKLIEAARKIYA